MANNRNTIPSSAIDFVVSILVRTPKPNGPIAAPATKYPKAGLSPSCLNTMIIATEASRRIRMSLK